MLIAHTPQPFRNTEIFCYDIAIVFYSAITIDGMAALLLLQRRVNLCRKYNLGLTLTVSMQNAHILANKPRYSIDSVKNVLSRCGNVRKMLTSKSERTLKGQPQKLIQVSQKHNIFTEYQLCNLRSRIYLDLGIIIDIFFFQKCDKDISTAGLDMFLSLLSG